MKTFIFISLMMISPFIVAQTTYDKAMSNAFENLKTAETLEDLQAVAYQFDRIATKDANKWEPLYYSLFSNTMMGFQLPKEVALQKLVLIEEDFKELNNIIENDETLVLKALIYTVKIAKDPMTFGRTLSGEVETLYKTALEVNPNNPRALYSLAQFKMGSANFWGKDPKKYCPMIQQAIVLFEQEEMEERSDFYPQWGKAKAQHILEEICLENIAE